MQASDQNYNGIHVFERKVNFGNVLFLFFLYLIYSTLLQTLKGNVTIIHVCVCVMVFLENQRFIIYNFK